MYYTVIKHSEHLKTLEKCRKHLPATHVFYISLVFSNAGHLLSQCNTRLRLLYLLSKSNFFSNERLCKKAPFKTEVRGNSEMALTHIAIHDLSDFAVIILHYFLFSVNKLEGPCIQQLLSLWSGSCTYSSSLLIFRFYETIKVQGISWTSETGSSTGSFHS